LSLHTEFAYMGKSMPLPLERVFREEEFQNSRIHYLKIPLAIQLRWNMDLISFKLFTGPYLAYAITATALEEDSNRARRFSLDSFWFSQLDIGATLGAGIDIELAKRRVMFIDVRINAGFKDIDLNPDTDAYTEGNAVTMGFMFPLGKQREQEQ
ncbi:MAG: outer membrane beta-barrel protein, partial [Bacteroidota bacterium]